MILLYKKSILSYSIKFITLLSKMANSAKKKQQQQ